MNENPVLSRPGWRSTYITVTRAIRIRIILNPKGPIIRRHLSGTIIYSLYHRRNI